MKSTSSNETICGLMKLSFIEWDALAEPVPKATPPDRLFCMLTLVSGLWFG